jgi:hypothetical protein
LRIHRNVALDARYLLACVIPFFLCRVRVLNALRINDAKARLFVPPMRGTLFVPLCQTTCRVSFVSEGSSDLASFEGFWFGFFASFLNILSRNR